MCIRDRYNYDLGFDAGSSFATNKDLQQFFDLSHFQFKKDIFEESRLDYFYGNPDFAPNHTFGRSSILAFFVMADYNITKKLRVSGGLRYENTDQKIDSDAYDKLNLPRNDIRRIYPVSYTHLDVYKRQGEKVTVHVLNLSTSKGYYFKIVPNNQTNISGKVYR